MRARWLVALSFLLLAPGAEAASLQPLDLTVEGGEESWHPESIFSLLWTNPPGVAAVHYRLLDPDGGIAEGEQIQEWPLNQIRSLAVRGEPGIYTMEIWLEDAGGAMGEPTAARLRFDDGLPGSVEPAPAPGWIGRTAFPYGVRLGHPAEPPPVSGIRGYAVAIDHDQTGRPCATAICTNAEIDLSGGVNDDRIAIGELPEGIWYVHAAAVSGAAVRSASTGTTTLRVDKTDPVTHLDGVPDGWSRTPVVLTASATDAASGMAPVAGGPVPFTAIAVDDGPPVLGPGDQVSLTLIGSGVHAVEYYARDAAGNVADGGTTNGLQDREPARTVVRIDREPPRISFSGSQDPRDPERIEASAADPLSGLDHSRGSVEVRAAGSKVRFTRLPTATRGGTLSAHWDSESCPPGEYEFRATVFDLAGNAGSTELRANGAPMRLLAPLKPAPRVSAQLHEVRSSRGSWLSGRLIAGRRAPLSGVPLRVLERFAAGATPQQRVSAATTDAEGDFAIRLEPGPSREVLVLSPATPTLRAAASQPLRLSIPSQVRLRVSSERVRVGGRPILFSGRVGTEHVRLPADGKVVALQFRLPGLPWREFRTVHTDRHGHFHYAYRFVDDDSRGARFQFRATAPAQAGWPYEPASSAPVAVTGF